VLSGSGPCDWLIPRVKDSYLVQRVTELLSDATITLHTYNMYKEVKTKKQINKQTKNTVT